MRVFTQSATILFANAFLEGLSTIHAYCSSFKIKLNSLCVVHAVSNDRKGAVVVTVDKPPNLNENGHGNNNINDSTRHKAHPATTRSDGAATKQEENAPMDATHVGDKGKTSGKPGVAGMTSVTLLREGECTAKDCRVLMTGCGRSGTHFIAEQLADAGILHVCVRIPASSDISLIARYSSVDFFFSQKIASRQVLITLYNIMLSTVPTAICRSL